MARKSAGGGAKAVAVITVGLMIAGVGPHHHHHSHHGAAALTARAVHVPASVTRSRAAWARTFLREIPEPRTRANICAVVSWEVREGGGFGNQAVNNPLNVNPPYGTPWPGYHAIGAWAFPSAAIGMAYTVRTVRSYPGVLAALHQAHDTQAVLRAVVDSPWAQSHYDGSITAVC